jgi:ATP-binding cassette subfamily B protein RaxB
MSFLDKVSFGFGRTLPVTLQTEATECGLACLGMVAGYYRFHIDLMSLRRRFPVSLKGATLAGLIQVAGQLGLGTRPLKLDLDHLRDAPFAPACCYIWVRRLACNGVLMYFPT